ncbi:hypothetical protein M8J75_001029 [Diaphorina citri]|nr:hypothetical protein M8J75_001029 [Diaphorina citri]
MAFWFASLVGESPKKGLGFLDEKVSFENNVRGLVVTRFSDVNIALQDQEYSRANERLFCETAPPRHLSIRSTQTIPGSLSTQFIPGSVSTQFIPGSLSALVMMPRRYFHAATRTTRLPLFWLEHFEYDLSENILSLPLWRPSPGLCLEKMQEDLGKCN